MIAHKAEGPAGGRVVASGLPVLVATLLVAAGMLVVGARPAEAVTFTVNKTGDSGDRNIDGVCDSKSNNGLQCPLRAAIEESNATAGADAIEFDIGGPTQTIKPGSPLPDITDAVTVDGYTQQGASPNTLAEGNDAVLKVKLNGSDAGTFADGLRIEASDSTIRGLVINRFDGDGINIPGSDVTGNNKVEGNFIGTNDQGTIDNGNGYAGVFIFSESNTVGGTTPDKRNVISGNDQSGVYIFDGTSTGNQVQGNYIGTNDQGTGDLGNADGVFFHGAIDNTVGGTQPEMRNLISGNSFSGVRFFDFLSEGNSVEGNFIGTTADGSGNLGNASNGVLFGGGDDNTIGGTASGAGNRIAHNGGDGVSVSEFSESSGNLVLSNSIFSNGGLGIDLGSSGVTSNDTDDPDAGANNLQNFPVITSVVGVPVTGDTFIVGTLDSNPNQSFTIQCFLTDGASASDHGEGSALLDTTAATTDANGDGVFFCTSRNPMLGQISGQTVSATATNTTTGDTSEFSENEAVPGPGP